MAPEPTRPAQSTRAVDRALALLEYVVISAVAPNLAEAARAVELPVSTTARLLGTLEGRGLLRRAGDGRYWPGVRMFHVGAAALRVLPIHELAGDHLEALRTRTGESAYLLMPVGGDRAVYIRQAESDSSIRHASWLGRTIGLAGTATGRAFAGAVDDEGYVTNRGSAIEPDASTAAAPVRSADGSIEGVMSVIAPSFRVPDERLREIARLVAEHARALSRELGAPVAEPRGPEGANGAER
jgi:urocanate hydratase